jgi:type 1 fimbriae regulatory protein FimB/type 1 fimbriae regulatory protein FimE
MLLPNKRPPPCKLKNSERRSREYLLPAEVRQLIEAAKKLGRHSHRDAVLIMMAYRHALRVGELINIPPSFPIVGNVSAIVRDVGVKLFEHLAQFFGF